MTKAETVAGSGGYGRRTQLGRPLPPSATIPTIATRDPEAEGEAQGAWNMEHFELVGYWCSLSKRMFPFRTGLIGSVIRCCAPVYPDHRPTAVYKVRTT